MTANEAMQLAILEAYKGWGHTQPNPMVGCVILDRHYNLISSGYHQKYGSDHAEINAIRKLKKKDLLEGAHMFVTLEPCAHVGKTPPCAHTLAVLPLGSVTYGLTDPNPLVAGRGAKILRAAGIRTVEYDGNNSELAELIEVHTHNLKSKRPFVILKVGTSLDGQMALKSGESKWITGEISRSEAHLWRAGCTATLVGRETFENDNPSLNVRHFDFLKHQNKVVILDPSGKTLKKIKRSKVYATHLPKNIFVVIATGKKIGKTDVNIITAKHSKSAGFDLKNLLRELFKIGIHSILVEGGGKTITSFLKQGLAQRLVVFQAPTILGAGGGLSWTSNLKISILKNKINLSYVRTKKLGDDILITGRLPDKASR